MEQYEATANEDLMREHGLLNRILICYDKIANMIENNFIIDHILICELACIVRIFIEDHHEKNEERYVFPVLLKNNRYVDLVHELIIQHKVGRTLTSKIIEISYSKRKYKNNLDKLKIYLQLFTEMYRVHESREDTIVFQEFKNLVTSEDYNKIGEIFESTERNRIGSYEKILGYVENTEKILGIYDISTKTKKILKYIV